MIKKLFSHTAIYGLAPYVPKVASIAALPILTKHLTPHDYGINGVISAYTAAVAVFNTLGLKVVLTNSFFKHEHRFKKIWGQYYGFLSLWNIPFALMVCLLLYIAVSNDVGNNVWLIILLNLIPIVSFGPTSMIATTYYQLRKEPLQIGIRTAFFGVLTIALNIYTIAYLHQGYMGWFWTNMIVGLLMNLSYWYPLKKAGIRPIYNFKWRLIKNSLKVTFPTLPHYYSSYLINSSDRLVMDLLKVDTSNIGRYNVAYTLGNNVQTVGMAFNTAIGPMIMEQFKKGSEIKARDLVFFWQAIFVLFTFGLSIWCKEIMYVLIKNESLQKTYPLAIIIIMSYNYRPMYVGSIQKLLYNEKTSILWKVTLIAGLVNVAMNLFLIPVAGYEIAAVATFVSLAFMGYAGYFFPVFKEINHVNYYPLPWLAAHIGLTFVAYYSVEIHFIYKIVISIILLTGFIGIWHKYRTKLR